MRELLRAQRPSQPLVAEGRNAPALPFVTAASLADRSPPDRLFLAPGLIPGRNVTLLSGNGGDGKSLLAAMLLTSVSSGALWLGMRVAHGGAIYFCAEDELDEVHRRLVAICAAEHLASTMPGTVPEPQRDVLAATLSQFASELRRVEEPQPTGVH